MVFVAPVYAAGEAPIEGIDAQALVDGLKRRGHRSAAGVADADALAVWLAETIQPGDLVICLGAGEITKWAAGLAPAIAAARAGGAAWACAAPFRRCGAPPYIRAAYPTSPGSAPAGRRTGSQGPIPSPTSRGSGAGPT